MSIEHTFTSDVGLFRVIRTPDGQGGFVESLSIVERVKGHARPLSANERVAGGYATTARVYRFYLPGWLDVREHDEIQLNADRFRFRVIAKADPATRGHHLEVDAEETH